MPIRPNSTEAVSGADGVIDYRLARLGVVQRFHAGELAVHEVCDSHPELVRAAREIGTPTTDECPICEKANLVTVRYVFGPRLPAHGRCVATEGEWERLLQRKGNFTVYEVEACPSCAFNHLRRSFPLPNH